MSKKLGFALSGLMLAMVAGTASADMDGGQLNISGLVVDNTCETRVDGGNKDGLILLQTALKFDLLTAYVDELSAPYLEDAEIDFVTDQLGSQLTLKAPNAKMRKVADDAPLMERVEYMLQSQINPQLAGHGGRVSLMEITEDGYAILQFGGGCNGCSMVDVTLKEGIEKQLLNEFPELKGVRDLTEHQRGEHSYY